MEDNYRASWKNIQANFCSGECNKTLAVLDLFNFHISSYLRTGRKVPDI